MKRVQYLHYGAPEELRLDEVTPPDPGRGQIRVQVRAAAANPMDWKIRRGEMKALTGFRFPRGLGHDFAGVVEAVGPRVAAQGGRSSLRRHLHPTSGRVCRMRRRRRKKVGLKPSSISFEQAAALTIVSLTAWNALVAKARLSAGQSVFITGCLGGVGRSAVQIARMRGERSSAVAARPGARKPWRLAWARSSTIAPSTSPPIGVASTWSSIRQARCR